MGQDSNDEKPKNKKEASDLKSIFKQGLSAPEYSKNIPVNKIENLFGADFKNVQIYNDAQAEQKKGAINAPSYKQKNESSEKKTSAKDQLAIELKKIIEQRAGRVNEQEVNHKITNIVENLIQESLSSENKEIKSNEETIKDKEEKLAPRSDYDHLSAIIFTALKGWSTDEEQVYRALSLLQKNQYKIKRLKTAYQENYDKNLEEHLRSEFSNSWIFGNEVNKALSYLQASDDSIKHALNNDNNPITFLLDLGDTITHFDESQMKNLAFLVKDAAGNKSQMFSILSMLKSNKILVEALSKTMIEEYEINLEDFINSKFDSANQELLHSIISKSRKVNNL